MSRPRAVAVVVPAHDEEALLPACLRSVAVAAAALDLPVQVVVVADTCTDRTVPLAAAGSDEVVEVSAGNVGVAREAGSRAALRWWGGPPEELWVAHTDADTIVGPDWLVRQVALAAQGADAVLGVVRVDDWSGHPASTVTAFRALYGEGATGEHPHVHGANLGVRASAWLGAGGVPPLALSEDHALLAGLLARGARVVRSREVVVATSARLQGRVTGGFADLLRGLPA